MTAILAWFASKGISEKALKFGGMALGIAAIVIGAMIWLGNHDDAVVKRHEDGVQLEVQTKGRVADQNLNDRINQGNAAIAEAREEFDNATASIPPEGLTRRQRIDLCGELRDAGTDTSLIAECSELPPRAEAGAVDRHPSKR